MDKNVGYASKIVGWASKNVCYYVKRPYEIKILLSLILSKGINLVNFTVLFREEEKYKGQKISGNFVTYQKKLIANKPKIIKYLAQKLLGITVKCVQCALKFLVNLLTSKYLLN